MARWWFRGWFAAISAMSLAGGAAAQVRVATWNLTEYSGESTRTAAFQASIFEEFSGRTLSPDVILVQEVQTPGGNVNGPANAFLALLNSAPGSPADYAIAPFFNGNDSDSACYYRTTRFDLLGSVVAVTGTSSPSTPVRNIVRHHLRLKGYTGAGASIYLFNAHLKASNTAADRDRRLMECTLWRSSAETLPPGSNFIFAGDFNFYSSSGTPVEPGFTHLTGPQANNDGRVFDPINKYAGWFGGGNSAVHTQSPTSAWGGMDDRFDMLLVSASLMSGQGFDYIGNPAVSMTNNWNDPNHSYRVWGNDGASYNNSIRVSNNAMVGPTIAQALLDHFVGVNSPPHLPVYLDLRVPARVSSVSSVNFGTVNVGSIAQQAITISNGANLTLFSKAGDGSGIDDLTYTLGASPGFTAPGGTFNEPASPGGNVHVLSMSTATPGVINGTLTITSDDPDQPVRLVTLTGIVASLYDYDVNADGTVDVDDLYAWHITATDVDGNGTVDNADRVALRDHLRTGESAQIVNGRR